MDSHDHKIQLSPGTKSPGVYVCNKCGWNYPNPHPSAKNRRSHKKICGTIKGFEILDTERAKKDPDLEDEHCFNDQGKTPSPRNLGKTDEKIGEIGDFAEEEMFTDAVCEFSPSPFVLVADSFKENEEIATDKNPSETQQHGSSLTGFVMKSSEVSNAVTSSADTAADTKKHGESKTEGQSLLSEAAVKSLQEAAYMIDGRDVGLETESKGISHISNKRNLLDESEAKLGSASEKKEDTLDAMWNDEVIYSDVEGPHGFALEADSIVSESGMVDTSPVKANAAQVINTSQETPKDKDDIPLLSVPDEPFLENADLSLPELKGLEAPSPNHSVDPKELPKEETDTVKHAESLGIQPEHLKICREVPLSDKRLSEDKAGLVADREYSSAENVVVSKIESVVLTRVDKAVDAGDTKMKAEETVTAQETVESENLKVSLPVPNPAANITGAVDLLDRESELIQANALAEINSPNSELTSESGVTELYVSPESIEHKEDDAIKPSKDSVLEISSEACKNNDETRGESSIGLVEEYPMIQPGSTNPAPVKTVSENLPERGRTDFHRVVGGLGVIQGNEIDCNVKEHNFYAEVPVTIESNDYRDLGRLQNLSEVHIRSLVSSPLVNRTASHVSEDVSNVRRQYDSSAGLSDGVNKPGNTSQSSLAVSLSKNQEIMEKTTDWNTEQEQQHVPLKNLLSQARTPKLQAKEESINSKVITKPKVSSILGQDTSPDARWPSEREVSEEWNSPARYPVDLKREERKVKSKPFWVPFVCCSSVN